MNIATRTLGVAAILLAIGAGACGNDLLLSVYDLDVGPSPAQPGDLVRATFRVDLIPFQSQAYVVRIDGEEHVRVTAEGRPAEPVVIELGDAADLIADYGLGAHAVQVEVHALEDGETARSNITALELVVTEAGG